MTLKNSRIHFTILTTNPSTIQQDAQPSANLLPGKKLKKKLTALRDMKTNEANLFSIRTERGEVVKRQGEMESKREDREPTLRCRFPLGSRARAERLNTPSRDLSFSSANGIESSTTKPPDVQTDQPFPTRLPTKGEKDDQKCRFTG